MIRDDNFFSREKDVSPALVSDVAEYSPYRDPSVPGGAYILRYPAFTG